MLKPVIVFLLCLFWSKSQCQSDLESEKHNKQSFYFELGGNGRSLLCVNYERIFHNTGNSIIHYAARTGIGFASRRIDTSGITNLPFEFTALIGKKKHYLEAGIGYTISFAKDYVDKSVSPPDHYKRLSGFYCFRLGYRFAITNGVVVRFAPSLQMTPNPTWKTELSWGLCLGLSFDALRDILE